MARGKKSEPAGAGINSASASQELRQFIERYERLESDKAAISTEQKELMSEAKGRGYDTKVMRKVIALRKRKPDEVAEEQAVLDLYLSALGMEFMAGGMGDDGDGDAADGMV